jgi:hypothetical protein
MLMQLFKSEASLLGSLPFSLWNSNNELNAKWSCFYSSLGALPFNSGFFKDSLRDKLMTSFLVIKFYTEPSLM